MIDKLEEVERRFERLTADLSNPECSRDSAKLQKVAKERAGLEKLVEAFRDYKKVLEDLKEAEAARTAADADERALGKEELPGAQGSGATRSRRS